MGDKEYIERGAFLKKCAEAWGYAGVTIKAIEGIADECTAADVVEVVRCKGCKHSTWNQEPCHGKVEYHCNLHGLAVDKHFYCASGERKEQT